MRRERVIELAFGGRPAHRAGMEPLSSDEHPLFAQAYRDNYADLLSFVRRRVHTEVEALDIVQETYLGLMRYRHQNSPKNAKALLFRIALNLIGMRMRTARAHAIADHIPLEGDELLLAADEPSHDRQIAGEQQLDRLMLAIEKLPPKCRQAFVLRRLKDMSLQEIAARMKISVKAVERHITLALAQLKKHGGAGS